MKLVKIFGIVMAFHGVAFMFIFAIPGCRSTSKKPANAPAPVIGSETSPLSPADPAPTGESLYTPSAEVSPVRFSPTRPGTPAANEVATAATPASSTHTVVKGDNLWTIARKHGLSVKELAAANKLRSDTTLKLGQKVIIPGKAAAATSAASAAPARASTTPAPTAPTTSITHVIKPGETLGAIAKKYQVKVGDIATANNIGDPTKIRAGQSLKIPGWQAPASARASAPATPAAAPAPSAPASVPAVAPEPLPTAPSFESPVSPAPAPAPAAPESPFIAPSTGGEAAPMIRVEESGAPRIE